MHETVVAIVVTYNRKTLLPECLEGLLNQTAEIEKIIIIDNASTDGTREAIQALIPDHPNLRYIYETRLGLATARNTGWRETRRSWAGASCCRSSARPARTSARR